ncbi:DUF418 domain-containing protein [Pseudoalteromonas sp. APC 3893]|uniref:DUF418 domain-containing protein n=1 Tax=Pseudoalteromonas sp. APC 3893 TaxID=3035175 RepID=UPI0025B47129|nr:DUF418 domain-containing protein [Pseudoalteromonas sp. APC 3893]
MRNNNMDVIRGVAVFGLMYMNAYFFGLFEYGYVPTRFPPVSDHIIQCISLIFIDGRFRSLFSLLFGAALYIQWLRYQDLQILQKRLKILAYFGLFHGFILWAGDILFIYACAGWFTCKYLNQADEIIVKRAVQFLSIGAAVSFLLLLIEPSHPLSRADIEFSQSYQDIYASWAALMSANAIAFFIMIIAVPLITIWMSAGLMLVGIFAYKKELFVKGIPNQYVKHFFVAALFFTALRVILEYQSSHLAVALREPVNLYAALFVALLFIHVVAKKWSQGRLFYTSFQCMGRLALSVYIMQTLILLLLFKVLYPSWILIFNRIDYFLLVTIIAILQLLLCQLYNHFFKYGPLEILWRKLSS